MTRAEGERDRRWPHDVYGVGGEPDPRFTLANERTLLAGVRTALALLAAAAAVGALPLPLPDSATRAIAVLLAVCGVQSSLAAWLGWRRVERALRLGEPMPSRSDHLLLVAGVAAVGAVLMLAQVWPR